MKATAVRLYGKNDLRMEQFELPSIAEDEILVRVVSDSICMSSYKAAILGSDHKRVPCDVDRNPIIIGHEFCGEIIEVGARWQSEFEAGQKFGIQPAINYKGSQDSPGYSYVYCGGATTYAIIPSEVMEVGCLFPFEGEAFFQGSLAEPVSCIIGAYRAQYHTTPGKYEHDMGIKPGGNLAILAGAGAMGLGAIDYALHADRNPGRIVVTDLSAERLGRAKQLYPPEYAAQLGIDLAYLDASILDVEEKMMELTDGRGYDDVYVYAPAEALIEQADRLLARDGCLNFFAGPTDNQLSAKMNFYNVHYSSTHIVGTSGGNTDDMLEALELMAAGKINPASMVTHVGGLDSAAEATLNLPDIAGGKKLIYTHVSMPLTAIEDFEALGKGNPLLGELARICKRNNNLWCAEAENYLLENAPKID